MSEKKLVLVTGSSSGIGRAIAQRLAQDGFHLLIHYNKNLEGAQSLAREIAASGGSCDQISFDIKNSEQVQESLDVYFKEHGELKWYGLVNNAGIHIDGMAGLMSDDDFDQVMKTNAYGAFYLMRAAIRRMLRQRQGSIVNISSLAGQTGNAGQLNYAASKAALIAMTKTLSMELGSRGLRVNAVAPGLIETEMIESIPELEGFKQRIPLRRFGRPAEVAGAVSFLMSEDASYITGHTLSVNGGLFPS